MRVLDKDGSVHELGESEVIYFTIYKNEIWVHTAYQDFILPTTFEEVLQAYAGLNFERVDRSYIVNLDKIEGYHPERQSVFFHDASFAPVSEKNKKKVIQYLDEKKKRD